MTKQANKKLAFICAALTILLFSRWQGTAIPQTQTSTAPESETSVELERQREKPHEKRAFEPQEWLKEKMAGTNLIGLLVVMALAILCLGKGADRLVDEAVQLSLRSGIPRVVVGATAVSMGTTAPEAVVSVLAAIQGEPGLALGNAVGSIICDTGLILGLACLISPLPINRTLVNRQGWIQFGSGILLVAACFPWINPKSTFEAGGNMSQLMGFVFIGLLLTYMAWSTRYASAGQKKELQSFESCGHSVPKVLVRLFVAIAVVVVASMFLIASATELAERLGVPESIIAATLVAFGTSLPELVIAIRSVLKNQGELAVGNVIGADILNVLFVAGAAAAVTPAGLHANQHFFLLQFPAMIFILLVFRVGIYANRTGKLARPFGIILLGTYLIYSILAFLLEH